MSRSTFLVWLIVVIGCGSAIGTLSYQATELFSNTSGPGYIYMLALPLVHWLSVYPALRYCWRRRLYLRSRSLHWADLPGATSFLGILVFAVVLSLHFVYGSDAARAMIVGIGRHYVISATFLPMILGLVLGAVLCVECFRADRRAAEAEVFD